MRKAPGNRSHGEVSTGEVATGEVWGLTLHACKTSPISLSLWSARSPITNTNHLNIPKKLRT